MEALTGADAATVAARIAATVADHRTLTGVWDLIDPTFRLALAQTALTSGGHAGDDTRARALAGEGPSHHDWAHLDELVAKRWADAWAPVTGAWEPIPVALDVVVVPLITEPIRPGQMIEAGRPLSAEHVTLRLDPEGRWRLAADGRYLVEPGWPPRIATVFHL